MATPQITHFFTAPSFAVLGASSNTSKFGHKLIAWYLDHRLPVTPTNPKESSILATPTVSSISDLAHPSETSVSVVTPPAVSLKAVDEAARAKVHALWFQPGAFDEKVLSKAEELGVRAVAGGGACVLVHGEEGLASAGSKL